jgi:hypothetical protein
MRHLTPAFSALVVVLATGVILVAAQPAGAPRDRSEVEHFNYGSVRKTNGHVAMPLVLKTQ